MKIRLIEIKHSKNCITKELYAIKTNFMSSNHVIKQNAM